MHRANDAPEPVRLGEAEDVVWKYGRLGQGFVSEAICVKVESQRTCWSDQPLWYPAQALPAKHSSSGTEDNTISIQDQGP